MDDEPSAIGDGGIPQKPDALYLHVDNSVCS